MEVWKSGFNEKLSSESQSPNVQSQVRSHKSKVKDLKSFIEGLGLCLLYYHYSTPPPPTQNFSDTSIGPTTKCYTFLETSHDP